MRSTGNGPGRVRATGPAPQRPSDAAGVFRPHRPFLNLGCGSGAQTLHLAELIFGPIIAPDSHAPFIERLRTTLDQHAHSLRVQATVADMARPGGWIAFTDAVWRVADPLPEIKKKFALDYLAMGRAEDIEARTVDTGYEQPGHFTLPDENFPMSDFIF